MPDYYEGSTSYYNGEASYYDEKASFYGEEPENIIYNETDITINSKLTVNGGTIERQQSYDTFVGDGSSSIKTLSALAWSNSLLVYGVTSSTLTFTHVWLKDVHYTENLNSDGYVESISPITLWPTNLNFRVYYYTVGSV